MGIDKCDYVVFYIIHLTKFRFMIRTKKLKVINTTQRQSCENIVEV
jgi:hypothetical protein